MIVPSEEEFIAWRDDPVTKFIMAACRRAAEENRESWTQRAWTSGIADQADLTECRVRADAYMALEETSYAGWVATHEGKSGE